MKHRQTPSQTVGPYFAYGLTPAQYGYDFRDIAGADLVGSAGSQDDIAGERIRLVGQVLDGEGVPVSDAMIEIWQADSEGRYLQPSERRNTGHTFGGFGRCGTGTDPENRFIFDTVRPGAIGDGSAPHINVIVFMRGMLSHAYTRVYFDDEPANSSDPVLSTVPEERRDTLMARRVGGPGPTIFRFDIRMQGSAETVFFDV